MIDIIVKAHLKALSPSVKQATGERGRLKLKLLNQGQGHTKAHSESVAEQESEPPSKVTVQQPMYLTFHPVHSLHYHDASINQRSSVME